MSINVLIPQIYVYLGSNSLQLTKWDVGFALHLLEVVLHME